jgi:hypothetical protein
MHWPDVNKNERGLNAFSLTCDRRPRVALCRRGKFG